MINELELLISYLASGVGVIGIGVMVWLLKGSAKSFISEIWRSSGQTFVNETRLAFRPYFVLIVVDVLISCSLWLMLFVFKALTSSLQITGFAGEVVRNIHSVGTVLVFFVFSYLFIVDVYRIHKKEKEAEKLKGGI